MEIISVVIFALAALVIITFKKIGQPMVLGYLVAGFLVSPYMPYMQAIGMTEHHLHDCEAFGQLGVMLIMFGLGLEFSFKKLGKMGASPIVTALFIACCMGTLGFVAGMMMGLSQINCIFLGGMLAMSSTAIIDKAFADLGLSGEPFTARVISVLILEDILAIVLLVMLSAMAQGSSDTGQIMSTIMNLGIFVAVSLIVGLLILPTFFRVLRKIMNDEMLLIVSFALLFSMAYLAEYLGFSTAFGAFIIGSILAETLEAHKIEKVTLPMKNLFGAVFFISVGMLVKVETLVEYWLPILILVLVIMAGQAVFGTIGYLIGGQTLRASFRSGFAMSQIGEFSFIIATVGVNNKAIPAELYPIIVAVAVITTFFTPYMIKWAEPAYNTVSKMLPQATVEKLNSEKKKEEKAGGSSSFFAKFWGRIFDYARAETGNLPRHCSHDIPLSEVLVIEGDLFDGKTVKQVMDMEENPYFVVGRTPDGELISLEEIPHDYKFKAGDKVRVISKKFF
ncbi:MAG: cation:proton antiporter [Bacteroidaceae bacterium]|nr:cation:proton antiporter [Bacteroidaceae bacterium]